MVRGVEPRGDRFAVHLPRDERDVLASLPSQLREALDHGEPTLFRLFPPAYADDDEANAGYVELVGQGLVEGKLRALAELERTAYADVLSEDELGAWLGALESLRLALGTQLDVSEATYERFDPADPDAPRLALYHWLSWLQEEVVRALAGELQSSGSAGAPTEPPSPPRRS